MTQHNFEPRHKDMGRHLASGIFNSGLVQAIRVLCQFGSVVILSRLLPPSDFGLIAMAGPAYGFVLLFQDLGLSQATVQKATLNHDEVNAFFWINVGVGTVLTVLAVALSPLVGWYYGEPRVVPLTAAMGLLIVIGAAGNQPGAILTRRMEFGFLAVNNVLGALSGLATSIILALILKNYWALYWGMAVGTFIPVAGVWLISRWKPSFPRRVSGLHEMLKFGGGITGANISNFFSGNMDNILIGWKWGDHSLGFYDRAFKLLLFPLQRMVVPVMGTLIPILSRLMAEPKHYRNLFLKTVAQLTLAVWPGIVWAIVLADPLVPILLGKQWKDSAPIFVPLAIAGLLQVVNYSTTCLFISQGRSGDLARWSVVNAVTCVTAFVIGLPYGAVGVATGFAISECLRTPFLWWYVTRRGPVKIHDVFRAILPQIVSILISGAVLLLCRKVVHIPPVLLLATGLTLSYAVVAITMSLMPGGRETLRQTIRAAWKILGHARKKRATDVANK